VKVRVRDSAEMLRVGQKSCAGRRWRRSSIK
jgi:hypothetical protein